MIGRFGGPKAEAVVVLGRQDHAFAAGLLQYLCDGVGIEVRRIEDTRIFVAVAPFLIGEGVDGEVQEVTELEFAPGNLARGRHCAEGLFGPKTTRGNRGKQKGAPCEFHAARHSLT